jgi:thiol:disulfide interchange protein
MPPQTPSRIQPAQIRKAQWIGLAVAILITAGTVLFLRSKPAAPAPAPTPTPAAFTPVKRPAPAYTPKHIYSVTAVPSADIAAGLAQARREHKRLILDFGGDWCGDCQVLDIYFHQAPNADLLDQNFVLVHVSIGHEDANLNVAAKYGVPISKGVPALAVLTPEGKVLYAQSGGEFEDMRHMDPNSVTEFLEKWKS